MWPPPLGRPAGSWRLRTYSIIFESETRAGRLFDLVLIATILASVVVVILDSVQSIAARNGMLFDVLEWGFTLLFTVEYVLRLACVRRPLRYATSFFGIVDLLAVLPTYLAFFVPEVHALIDDHRGLRRHHAEDRPGPFHRVVHDADGMGHPGRPYRHRHRRDDRPPHRAVGHHAHVRRLPGRRPRRRRAIPQALRQAAARLAARLKGRSTPLQEAVGGFAQAERRGLRPRSHRPAPTFNHALHVTDLLCVFGRGDRI
jgi:hypothetical protein